MRIDRTWTISFEIHEQNFLLSELKSLQLPADLGWKPILNQLIANPQITLPLRAVERLSLELDMARSLYIERASPQDFQRYFPLINALTTEVESILYSNRRKSA